MHFFDKNFPEALAFFRAETNAEEIAKAYNRQAANMIEVFCNHDDHKRFLDTVDVISVSYH